MTRQHQATIARIMAAASITLTGASLCASQSWADAENQSPTHRVHSESPGAMQRITWLAHDGPVSDIRFISPDQLISVGWDGYLRQWSVSGKPLKRPIKLHETWITRIAVCSQKQFVMTASRDNNLKQVDLVTGKVLGKPLEGHENGVESLALSADCSEVLSGSSDGTMRRWEVASGRHLDTPFLQEKGNQTVRDIAPDPTQSSRFAFALKTGVGLVDLTPETRRDTSNWFQRLFSRRSADKAKYKLTYFRQFDSNRAVSLAWDPSGEMIAVAYSDASITVWRVRDGKALERYSKVHSDEIKRIMFSKDGRSIYSVGFDGRVRATSAVSDSGTCTLFHLPYGDLPISLALQSDKNLLGVGSLDGRIYLVPTQGASCR